MINNNKSFRLDDKVTAAIEKALEDSGVATYNDLFMKVFLNPAVKAVKAKQINEDLDYLYSKINWGASFLDSKAVTIMNELSGKIRDLEKQHESRQNTKA